MKKLIVTLVLAVFTMAGFSPAYAAITHTEGALDDLLVALDSDADGAFDDETWYTDLVAGGGGGGIAEVSSDTSPQLGGNLDLNGFNIEGVTETMFTYIDMTSSIQNQLDAKATTTTIADNTGIGLDIGTTYTNFGIAGDDTLNELFAAIDSSWPAGATDAFTVKVDDAATADYLYDGGTGAIRAGSNVSISDDGDYITISASLAGGAVDTSGVPVLNDIPRFTDADTIEGLSYSEFANVMESSLEAVMDLEDMQGTLALTQLATTGSWTPTGTIDFSGATMSYGLLDADMPASIDPDRLTGDTVDDDLIDAAMLAGTILQAGDNETITGNWIFSGTVALNAAVTMGADINLNANQIVSTTNIDFKLGDAAGTYAARFYNSSDTLIAWIDSEGFYGSPATNNPYYKFDDDTGADYFIGYNEQATPRLEVRRSSAAGTNVDAYFDADELQVNGNVNISTGHTYQKNNAQINIGDLAAGGDWTPTGSIDLDSATLTLTVDSGNYTTGSVDATHLNFTVAPDAGADNYSVTYDNTSGGFTLVDVGGATGDSIEINTSAVTDPNFVSTGDVMFTDATNTITADINSNVVDSGHYVDDSIDNVHINWDDIDNLGDEGALAVNTVDSDQYVDNSLDAEHISDWYDYNEIPIAWMQDGTSAPAALDEASTRSPFVYRDFDSAADEDLNLVWFVPADLSGTTIQYRVKYLITNATGPSATEGVAFGLSGVSAGDNDATNGTKGTVVVVQDDTLTASQWDVMVTGWSGDVTVTALAAGEVAELALIRDVSDTVDDYLQDVGVLGIEIRYVKNVTR